MFLGPQSLGKQQKEVRVCVENSGRTSQVWQTHLVACRDRRAWPYGTAGPEWTKGAAEDEPDNTKAEHKPKAAQPDVVDTNTEPSEGMATSRGREREELLRRTREAGRTAPSPRATWNRVGREVQRRTSPTTRRRSTSPRPHSRKSSTPLRSQGRGMDIPRGRRRATLRRRTGEEALTACHQERRRWSRREGAGD